MEVDDTVRLKVLKSLIEKGVTQPNLRRIKKKTKLHLATIKSSIDFLEKKGILTGFGPKVSFNNLGYKLVAIELLQLDFSKQKLVEKYMEIVKNDNNIYAMNSIMGSGNFNILAFHFYPDVESYHANLQENYIKKIPNYYELVRDRQVFYQTEPTFKNVSRTNSMLAVLLEKKGMDY